MEYARTLGNPQYSIPQIQPYKLVYAHLLVELGLLEQARKYHQSITTAISKNRNFPYNPWFLNQLEEFEKRLTGYSANEYVNFIVIIRLTYSSSTSNYASWIPKIGLGGLFQKSGLINKLIRNDSREFTESETKVSPVTAPPPQAAVVQNNPEPSWDISTKSDPKDESPHETVSKNEYKKDSPAVIYDHCKY